MSPVELRTEEDDRVRDPNAVPGIWILLLFDMSFFALLFLSFLHQRSSQVAVFDASQAELTVALGLINMVVLLTSSWFVVVALDAARNGRSGDVARWLSAAFGCGAIFIAIKIVEYTLKFDSGIDLGNDYFTYYFVMTGLHALHVLAGMVMLAVMTRKARRGGYTPDTATGLQTGATYWHMVDLLWVMIFPVLYLAS